MPPEGDHWPPGLEEVTFLLIATISKLIGSSYVHQSICATAAPTALLYQDRLRSIVPPILHLSSYQKCFYPPRVQSVRNLIGP